ncbi:MAG: tRNA preQ1(34) S-adenosylmethionine ribosyltransferase-isomerase QueA [Candidatus Melainabacteria bacterium]
MTSYGLFTPNLSGLALAHYDYPLPEDLIASYPLAERDASRMLVLNRATGALDNRQFAELPGYLQPGDCLVLNNTRVLPARFIGNRRGFEGTVEVLLLNPTTETTPADPPEADTGAGELWTAMMRPIKKLKGGTIIEIPGTTAYFVAMPHQEGGRGRVRVCLNGAFETTADLMLACGQMPIPPYLGRLAEESDKTTYQTVFSRVPGAQAAPTAGLHFTPAVLEAIRARGVQVAEVTLSVSSGTFRSVSVENVAEHRMDPEWYTVSAEAAGTIEAVRAAGGRVVAVGTTVAKTLETVAGKFGGRLQADSAASELFIYPGYRFAVVDALLTNFHLPNTTLLMLVSAFASREQIGAAYAAALSERYRFFSYGDCMLIL